MNFFYNLSLQSFNPLAFKDRSNFYWIVELSSLTLELILFFLMPFNFLVCLSIFFFRVFFVNSSLVKITSKIFYFIIFIFKFQTDLVNIVFLFEKRGLQAPNIQKLIIELRNILISDLLDSHLGEDQLIYYFYRHKIKLYFREKLFLILEKKILSAEAIHPETLFFKNLIVLLKAFKKTNPGLENKERALLTCLGIKIEHQVNSSFSEVFNPNQFIEFSEILSALKDFRINWHSFPNLGLKSNPCAETLAHDPYTWGTLSITQKRLRQLINLVIFFNDTNTLEESYLKLYKNKKRMRTCWMNFINSSSSDLEILSWMNFNTLTTMWSLNYDELLKIHEKNKVPKHFYINTRKTSDLSDLGSYLKTVYTHKRIISMLIKDGGTNEFNECIKAFISFTKSPILVPAPKKPKNFREVHDFFQIYGTYREECLESLPQRNLDFLYGQTFENYIFKIPKTRKDLLLAGRKLSICVGSSDLYTQRVKDKESYIIFLCDEDEPKYCLELCQKTLEIKQAKGIRNHQLETDTLFRVRDYLKTSIGIDENKENPTLSNFPDDCQLNLI
jgi:hypothetical protein